MQATDFFWLLAVGFVWFVIRLYIADFRYGPPIRIREDEESDVSPAFEKFSMIFATVCILFIIWATIVMAMQDAGGR